MLSSQSNENIDDAMKDTKFSGNIEGMGNTVSLKTKQNDNSHNSFKKDFGNLYSKLWEKYISSELKITIPFYNKITFSNDSLLQLMTFGVGSNEIANKDSKEKALKIFNLVLDDIDKIANKLNFKIAKTEDFNIPKNYDKDVLQNIWIKITNCIMKDKVIKDYPSLMNQVVLQSNKFFNGRYIIVETDSDDGISSSSDIDVVYHNKFHQKLYCVLVPVNDNYSMLQPDCVKFFNFGISYWVYDTEEKIEKESDDTPLSVNATEEIKRMMIDKIGIYDNKDLNVPSIEAMKEIEENYNNEKLIDMMNLTFLKKFNHFFISTDKKEELLKNTNVYISKALDYYKELYKKFDSLRNFLCSSEFSKDFINFLKTNKNFYSFVFEKCSGSTLNEQEFIQRIFISDIDNITGILSLQSEFSDSYEILNIIKEVKIGPQGEPNFDIEYINKLLKEKKLVDPDIGIITEKTTIDKKKIESKLEIGKELSKEIECSIFLEITIAISSHIDKTIITKLKSIKN
jgi:hypothetical protein